MAQVNASFIVRTLAEQGKLEEAEQMMKDAGFEHGPGGPTVFRSMTWGRAILHEAQGNLEAVRVDVAPLQEDEEYNRSMKALPWRALLARTISQKGYSEEAEQTRGRAPGLGRMVGPARRSRYRPAGPGPCRAGRAQGGAPRSGGRDPGRIGPFAGGGPCPARLRRRVAEGRPEERPVPRSSRQPSRSRWTAAARQVAENAAKELEIAGAAPKRLSFDELTASERRVAEFAAGGKTNREIADELFVTPKTIENHLTHVYSKLGVGSRQELEAVL